MLIVLLLWLHLGVKGFKGNFEVSFLRQFDRNSVQNKSECQQTKIAYFCYEIFRATHYFVIVEIILLRPLMRTKTSILDNGLLEESESSRYSGKFNSIDPFRRKIKELKLSIHFLIVLFNVKFLLQLRFSLTK